MNIHRSMLAFGAMAVLLPSSASALFKFLEPPAPGGRGN